MCSPDISALTIILRIASSVTSKLTVSQSLNSNVSIVRRLLSTSISFTPPMTRSLSLIKTQLLQGLASSSATLVLSSMVSLSTKLSSLLHIDSALLPLWRYSTSTGVRRKQATRASLMQDSIQSLHKKKEESPCLPFQRRSNTKTRPALLLPHLTHPPRDLLLRKRYPPRLESQLRRKNSKLASPLRGRAQDSTRHRHPLRRESS